MSNYYELTFNDTQFCTWLQEQWTNSISKVFLQNHNHTLHQISVDKISQFELIKNLKEVGLVVDNCKFFSCIPNVHGGVHIDGFPARKCAINIPIENCDKEGYMAWYNNPEVVEKPIVSPRTRIILPEKEPEVWNEMETLQLAKPTLVKVDVWHGVNNINNSTRRVVFSLRFAGNPSYAEVRQILENNNI